MRQTMRMSVVSPNPTQPVPASATRLRLGKLCIAIQAGSAAEMIQRAEQALADARFLEFRLDSLAKPAEALPKLKQFFADHHDVAVIATCRRKQFGGNFAGSLAEELAILRKSAEMGCALVDLEVESAEEAKPRDLAGFRDAIKAAGAALLISFHDFSKTQKLEQVAQRIEAFHPDFVKVVSTARSLADNLAVLRLIEDRSRSTQIVGIAMGEEGLRQPCPRPSRRRRLHLRRSVRWIGNRSGPSLRAKPPQPLSNRSARPRHALLWRRRQSDHPFPFAAHAQHGLS